LLTVGSLILGIVFTTFLDRFVPHDELSKTETVGTRTCSVSDLCR
jgi:hypothetical protein